MLRYQQYHEEHNPVPLICCFLPITNMYIMTNTIFLGAVELIKPTLATIESAVFK